MKFTISTDCGDAELYSPNELETAVDRLSRVDGAFVTIIPEAPVQGVTYMQAMFTREMKGFFRKKLVRAYYQVEAQMEMANGDLVQYALESESQTEATAILRGFFESLKIPNLSGWKSEVFDTQNNRPRDYSVLPEMAQILTNGNEQAAADMRLLSESVSDFVFAHSEWCAEMDYADFGTSDGERQDETLLVFAYWLAGYSATGDGLHDPRQFGAYIDWKEETNDIIGLLSDADGNLGYGFDLREIKFDYSEFTDKALQMMGGHLSAKGLTLCALDTQSDSYHLFVLRAADFERLTVLAGKAGFRFYRDFR